MVLLCQYHHRLVHEQGWKIQGDPNGELRFIRPDGVVRCMGPPPLDPEIGSRFFEDGETRAG